jgi:predicted nucleic acid-binding protein
MIVIDSSAIVHSLVASDVDPKLLALVADEPMHAPHLLDFEVASSLRRLALGSKVSDDRAKEALDDYVSLTVERYDVSPLLEPIWRLRHNVTVYDASYVVLAQALDCPLVTSDAKLIPAKKLDVDVRVYPPTR